MKMAATGGTSSKQKEFLPKKKNSNNDLAKRDGKLKEMIRMQEIASRLWEEKWGFMRHRHVDEIYREEALERGLEEEFMEKRRLKGHRKTASPPDPTVRQSTYVPQLSSGFVGWRSSVPECTLEKVGPIYTSPKLSMEPPRLENDLPREQTYIFLG